MVFDRIPAELQEQPFWIVWKYEQRQGKPKPTKVPCTPRGVRTSVTDPAKWPTFFDAVSAYLENPKMLAGIGFVFAETNPFAGVDFDDCISDGVIHPETLKIINELDSYPEISPSGTGVKIILKATMPNGKHGRNKLNVCGCKKIEMYDAGRFFTVTGNHLSDASTTVNERQAQFSRFYFDVFGREEEKKASAESTADYAKWREVSDEEIIRLVCGLHTYERLWNGGHTEEGDKSKEDFKVCAGSRTSRAETHSASTNYFGNRNCYGRSGMNGTAPKPTA